MAENVWRFFYMKGFEFRICNTNSLFRGVKTNFWVKAILKCRVPLKNNMMEECISWLKVHYPEDGFFCKVGNQRSLKKNWLLIASFRILCLVIKTERKVYNVGRPIFSRFTRFQGNKPGRTFIQYLEHAVMKVNRGLGYWDDSPR